MKRGIVNQVRYLCLRCNCIEDCKPLLEKLKDGFRCPRNTLLREPQEQKPRSEPPKTPRIPPEFRRTLIYEKRLSMFPPEKWVGKSYIEKHLPGNWWTWRDFLRRGIRNKDVEIKGKGKSTKYRLINRGNESEAPRKIGKGKEFPYDERLAMVSTKWTCMKNFPQNDRPSAWSHFFMKALKRGDVERESGGRGRRDVKYRRVVKETSPPATLEAKPEKPTKKIYLSYKKRLRMLPKGWFIIRDLDGNKDAWRGFLEKAVKMDDVDIDKDAIPHQYRKIEIDNHKPIKLNEGQAEKMEELRKAGIIGQLR